MSDENTKKPDDPDLELRARYDFSKGERGRYAARYREGTNIVVLDPDVAKIFRTSEAVNDALREIAKQRRASDA